MFKILNELVEIPTNDRLIPADRRTRGGHNQAYKHLGDNTTLGQHSFWHRTIRDWNSLPAAAIESKTAAAFKSQLFDQVYQPFPPSSLILQKGGAAGVQSRESRNHAACKKHVAQKILQLFNQLYFSFSTDFC